MQARMSFLFTVAVVGLASLFVAQPAKAGTKSTFPVYIYNTSNPPYQSASGVIADARSEGDSSASIGCSITATPGGPVEGYCDAFTSTQGAGCWTTDPSLIQVIASMKGDSYISFSTNNSNGTCSYISTTVGSWYAPKTP